MEFQTWLETLGVSVEGSVEGYTSLSFKVNKTDLGELPIDRLAGALIRYIAECSDGEQKFITIGEHKEGMNENVHFHVNIAVPTFRRTSNESRRRTTYLEKTEGIKIAGLSCKVYALKDNNALENCLKYPWKERNVIEAPEVWDYLIIPKEVQLYMLESAHAIFLAAVEQQRRKARASERSMNLLDLIDDIVGKRTFDSYEDYKIKVCKDFYSSLELNEYPVTNNLRSAIQNVAIKRGIVPPHYFI